MPPGSADAPGTRGVSRASAYALVTLVAAVGAAVLVGRSPERVWGILLAWVVQAVAYSRLDRALVAGRDARKAWVGGMAARFGGLTVTGALTLAGVVSDDLPVAYGIGMLVLLLMEAGWLAWRPST